jgi:hypothetical protein
MPGITIEEELGGDAAHAGQDDFNTGENIPMDDSPSEPTGSRFDFSFLKAKTGEGSIDHYLDHPMNFNESRAVARMLRGASGLIGELDLAVIDIAVGAMDFMRGRRSHGVD